MVGVAILKEVVSEGSCGRTRAFVCVCWCACLCLGIWVSGVLVVVGGVEGARGIYERVDVWRARVPRPTA